MIVITKDFFTFTLTRQRSPFFVYLPPAVFFILFNYVKDKDRPLCLCQRPLCHTNIDIGSRCLTISS